MIVTLSCGKQQILSAPIAGELDFYRLIFRLEHNVKGDAAISYRTDDGKIIINRKLNKPPRCVFNPFTERWVDFDFFKEHFYDFPLTTRMLYASFINDKELRNHYGFL